VKFLIFLIFFLIPILHAQELQVKANLFETDEKKGVSVFNGDVNVIKGTDELNASEVTIYTNQEHKPTKFIAVGDVSFNIETENGAIYKGQAGKVIYLPLTKEYLFFTNVHLQQVDEKKEIIGEEVVLKTIEGKAYAKGAKSEPVIMIFDMPEKEEDKK